ncbi:P-type conjugative transfer protein TrbL [Helicobacter cetorum]|uniref:NADH-ubiquinone oxidoreductase subunit n=1 Tax=Helicobacter cetorum (strain ATCC BAA-540 / CCUG 52418 / MIT 99-5656) TaxID=1163745 RepID=I0EQ32_HELCM|nr:P-type conjugative transfer protein TrbL [Helicobacter cetorum]AFI05051.1 NADH-ubiquinone oxidoreductase subunit [Helicobacter cetorum MIT 99-5656]
MKNNAYEIILSWFITPLTAILGRFAEFFLYTLHAQFVFNSVVALAFMLFAYKSLKEQNLFSSSTLLEALLFVGFFALFNYALKNPMHFYEFFQNAIFILPNMLTQALTQSLATFSDYTLSIDFIFNHGFYALSFISDLSHKEVGVWLILSVLQALFLSVLFAIIILVYLEVHVWCSLGVLLLAFGFFKSWRSVLIMCLKKCLALGFYKPFLLVVGFLNVSVTQALIKAHMQEQQDLSLLLVVALFLCCALIIGVPFFINALFRTQNSLKETYKLATNLGTNLNQNALNSLRYITTQSNVSHSTTESKEQISPTHSPIFKVETTPLDVKIPNFKQKKVKKDTIKPQNEI